VVSGLLDITRVARALELGASDFLLKPIDRDRLREAIDKATGSPSKPSLA